MKINVIAHQRIGDLIPAQEGELTSSEFVDKSVSRWSKFGDEVWILSIKTTIYWLTPPEREANFDQTDYQVLLRSVKVLADILLNEEGLSSTTVRTVVGSLKEFIAWMLTRPIPIKHFRNVTKSRLVNYVREMSDWSPLRGKEITGTNNVRRLGPDAVNYKVRAISRLYQYRSRLKDGLQVMPVDLLDFVSHDEQVKGSIPKGSKTLPIPDEEHKEILGAAVGFMRDNADQIITGFAAFIKDAELLRVAEALDRKGAGEGPLEVHQLSAQKIGKALSRFEIGKLNILPPHTSLSMSNLAAEAGVSFDSCVECLGINLRLRYIYRKLSTASQTNTWEYVRSGRLDQLRPLQLACFIILASSTGMRLGELLALAPGCLVQKEVKGYEGSLYWLKSTLTKTSPNVSGEIAYWLCGELAAQAVQVLERLHNLLPTTFTAKQRPEIILNDSLFRSYVWSKGALVASPLNETALYVWTKSFIKKLELSVGHVHPHQFRRTFARNVVRWSNAPILALQRHFKHWSLLMTDYYIGVDDQLVQLYLYELQADSRKRLRQIMAGETGGPGGMISQKRLIKLADNEELPLNFRGKEHSGGIEELVREMCEDGVVAYKCGDFTTCLYVPGLAKCGDDGPKAHECHPTECLNSYILLEDVPFYLHNIRQNLASYKQQRKLDKEGPIGHFFLDRIRRDVISIKPLVPLYTEKLQQLQDHYDGLDQQGKGSSYGKVLRSRIKRDSLTLEFVMKEHHV